MYCAWRGSFRSIVSESLWFLSMGSTERKNTVCLLLKFCPPSINPELMNLAHFLCLFRQRVAPICHMSLQRWDSYCHQMSVFGFYSFRQRDAPIYLKRQALREKNLHRSPGNGECSSYILHNSRVSSDNGLPRSVTTSVWNWWGSIGNFLIVPQLVLLVVEHLQNPILWSSRVSRRSVEEAEVTFFTFSKMTSPVSVLTSFGIDKLEMFRDEWSRSISSDWTSILFLCKLIAHPTWKVYRKKSLGIRTLSCKLGPMRLVQHCSWRINTILLFFLVSS